MSPEENIALQRDVEAALQEVLDPEIGGSIVDIGLIYGIESADGVIQVTMTTTSRGCPATGFLVDAVRERVLATGLSDQVEVVLTYDPPWSPSMMRN
ncbi:MAG: metal-sulfur cluster assembly factor [Hyphomicrobiales bacterium]|nr:MAG: metal-sulfur cluster assembly factor [Hyphomicrobiales bacterium]